MELSTHQKGLEAEKLVLSYLKKKGWQILHTNYRTLQGEIDIIARDHKEIVVIEVKSGQQDVFTLTQSVDHKKRKTIESITNAFLSQKKLDKMPVRFDIITVSMPTGKIHHFSQEFFDD